MVQWEEVVVFVVLVVELLEVPPMVKYIWDILCELVPSCSGSVDMAQEPLAP